LAPLFVSPRNRQALPLTRLEEPSRAHERGRPLRRTFVLFLEADRRPRVRERRRRRLEGTTWFQYNRNNLDVFLICQEFICRGGDRTTEDRASPRLCRSLRTYRFRAFLAEDRVPRPRIDQAGVASSPGRSPPVGLHTRSANRVGDVRRLRPATPPGGGHIRRCGGCPPAAPFRLALLHARSLAARGRGRPHRRCYELQDCS
jgi:hypothetical protein